MKLIRNPIISKQSNSIRSSTALNFKQSPNLDPDTNSKLRLPGIELGFPLNIFQFALTYCHYGYNVISPSLVLLQFLIGFYTYGSDRFYDALDARDNEETFPDEKKELYEYILRNEKPLKLFLDISYYLIFTTIFYCITVGRPEAVDINQIIQLCSFSLVLLESTKYYKSFKEILGYLKGFYVAGMWTLSSVILPCLITDGNFQIINYPLDYLPIFFIIFSTSTLLDIRDIDEDKKNDINTLPVLLGAEKSVLLANTSLILSSMLLIWNIPINYINFIQNGNMSLFIEIILALMNPLIIFSQSKKN